MVAGNSVTNINGAGGMSCGLPCDNYWFPIKLIASYINYQTTPFQPRMACLTVSSRIVKYCTYIFRLYA